MSRGFENGCDRPPREVFHPCLGIDQGPHSLLHAVVQGGSSIAVSLSIPKLFARMMFAPSAQYFSSSFSRLITSRASAPEMESSNPK